MNYEAWTEPGFQPPFPIRDPLVFERVEFAFTKRQREWWLRVYENIRGVPQCAFPRYNEARGWHRCDVTGADNLEIHHIKPTAWLAEQEPWQDPNETLGIALCDFHHRRTIHPDIGEAFDRYGEDKGGIARAVEKHRELARQGIVFWRDDFDETMTDIAEVAKQRYMAINPGDPYPKDPSWEKKQRPQKKGWWQ